MSDALEFHSFPELATELHLKAWNEAMPNPRVIPVLLEVEDDGKDILRFPTYAQAPDIISDEAMPSMPSSFLRVNVESRELILSKYRLAFDGLPSAPLYIDWSREMLYFFCYDLLDIQRLCEDERHRHNTRLQQLSEEGKKEVMEKRKAWMNQV
ncbi:hypothetical protein BDZ45DRAFT_698068 [Acephala macrosclerotiorum]|nr:hypothetical protein BDZ45DRAFT_698068 [Acephala macrosclerotiorum]